MVEFLQETGLTLELAEGRMEDIPRAEVVAVPYYKHGKPFVTYEEQINLGTQMYNLNKWYMHMSRKEMNMFEVKYSDQDLFRGEDEFWVDFELLHHIYCR
jgi:hypothetical protein